MQDGEGAGTWFLQNSDTQLWIPSSLRAQSIPQQEMLGESQMTSNRETVPAERLEQPASLKANFLLSGTAEQQQNRCKKPIVGNVQWLGCITDLIPPTAGPVPHSLERQTAQQTVLFERTPAQPLLFCGVGNSCCDLDCFSWGQSWEEDKLQHNPWGRFLSYLFPGSYINIRVEGYIVIQYSPHIARCRRRITVLFQLAFGLSTSHHGLCCFSSGLLPYTRLRHRKYLASAGHHAHGTGQVRVIHTCSTCDPSSAWF